MQLKKLYIKDYKILKNFTIDFPYDFKQYISVLIGTNGSGKSTILEAIAQIFSNAVLNKKAKFGFELEYSVRLDNITEETFNLKEVYAAYILVTLKANEGEKIKVSIDSGMDDTDFKDKIISGKHKVILNQGSNKVALSYLPDNVVVYYSGLSEIMQKLVEPHNEIISTAYRKNNTLADRDFFYFQPEHFGIILTSLLSFEFGDIPDFLRTKAKINSVQSIKIKLQKPEWASDSIQNFWGAEGEVRNFLDYLSENSTTVDGLANSDNSNGIGNIVIEAFRDEAITITIISQERLFEIRNHLIEERKIFEILNTIFTDGMLKNISFTLTKVGEDVKKFGVLSEGEQQAIIIKGLTELLSESNSLFLFDEPDTYLHPKWQRQFITDIENTINSGYNSENSFVIATHSPQLLSNAKSELNFVKIIEDGELIENTPRYYGREINSILYDLMGVEEEHFLCQDDNKDKELNYKNMLLACSGQQGSPYRLQTCDTRKKNLILSYSPYNPTRNIENLIKYKSNGEIYSIDDTFNAQLETVLNLNVKNLKDNRRVIYEEVQSRIRREGKKQGNKTLKKKFLETEKAKLLSLNLHSRV